MKPISVFLLLAVTIQSLCYADATKFTTTNASDGGLSAEDRKMLQDPALFHAVHSTRDLPSAVVTLCTEDGKIADPGQKWNATCVITD
jgi:hypothetical protein